MSTYNYIIERIETKKSDYRRYDFSQQEDAAFKTFFDLAQEFDEIDDFYFLCVAIPKAFFGVDARLYLLRQEGEAPYLVAASDRKHQQPAYQVVPAEYPYCTKEDSMVLTIRGKKLLMEKLPFKAKHDVMGLMEIYPASALDSHLQFFFEKYANRIGFNLHNRFLVEKNIEHLRFIRSLVADIEHNIIAPNMVYKLLLRNLKSKIDKNRQIEVIMGEYIKDEHAPSKEDLSRFQMELTEVNQGLVAEYDAIDKHYRNMSLFLETLLRRGHFDTGRLILRAKPCNMRKEVVQPQLEQYLDRFRRMGIAIDDKLSGIPDEEVISTVDVGLLAQVYANLFSNALKYTREAADPSGEKQKFVSYGREIIKDFFGPGRDGVKYNVFSTGPHVNPHEHQKIFEEGYRGQDAMDRPGTGHGLSFIKNVIELHGGVVGYEPTHMGNNFYFVLPKK